jgi:hypothetical protein
MADRAQRGWAKFARRKVARTRKHFAGLLCDRIDAFVGAMASCRTNPHFRIMKNDLSFKLVVVTVIAGVILSFVNPAPATQARPAVVAANPAPVTTSHVEHGQ